MPTASFSAVPGKTEPAAGIKGAARGDVVAARPHGRHEIRIAGSGGQGSILAATILADAACEAGRQVIQTQSYGPEARGGASKAEVIIADEPIDFPEVLTPDVTVCLSQVACDAYAAATRAGGLLLYDDDLVVPPTLVDVEARGVPFARLARKVVGKPVAANVVALGALERCAGLVGRDELVAALSARLPARIVEANVSALDAGLGWRRRGQAAAAAAARQRPPRRRAAD